MADNKYVKLVEAKLFKKLAKCAKSRNVNELIEVADACGTGRSEEPYNILTDLLAHEDKRVKEAAIRGMGNLRYDISSQMTRLHWLAERLPDGTDDLKAAISDALASLRDAKK